MSLEATHPLPARNLVYDIANGYMAIDDGHTYRWGPWMCQGYAWCTGFLYFDSVADGSVFNIYQGFEDRGYAVVGLPPFGHWHATDTFAINHNTLYPWKVEIFSEALFFEFIDGETGGGDIEITGFLRND